MDLFVIKTVSEMFYFLLNSFILVYKTALERFENAFERFSNDAMFREKHFVAVGHPHCNIKLLKILLIQVKKAKLI